MICQVSIYAHSLGSVLSYDILCHQDTLSSPFPMEWMYTENDMDEDPQPSISSDCNLKSKVENKGFTNDESSTSMEYSHEQETSADSGFQSLVDKDDASFCSSVDPAASSHLDGTMPNGTSLTDQSTHDLDNNSNDLISFEKETTDDPVSTDNVVKENHANKSDEEMLKSDKDRTVQLLREEVTI